LDEIRDFGQMRNDILDDISVVSLTISTEKLWILIGTDSDRGDHVGVSVKDGNWQRSLQAPDTYQFITAADCQQSVTGIHCNVGDLCCMTTHCTQQTTRDTAP